MDFRKGPWTQEEDSKLRNYVNIHGEGHWSSLSRSAGLNRTGKSCRLRWLNYLKPNVRRGNITLEEQLLILELNLLMGNRWSKIAKYLPGRTDNEIKNYWRTKVKKQAKQLKCDVTSQKFKDTLRYVWMPRLVEQIQLTSSSSSQASEAQPINTADHSTSINNISQQPVTDPSLADPPINIELPARKFMESANYCNDLFGNNEIYNCFQDGSIYCTESVAAPNTDCYASGEGQSIQDSKNLLSGDDSLELLPQYYDIWNLQQQIYDDVYFN